MSNRSRIPRALRTHATRQPEPFPMGEAYRYDGGTRAARRAIAERTAARWPLSALVTAAALEPDAVATLATLHAIATGPTPVVLADPAGHFLHPVTYATPRRAVRALAGLRHRRLSFHRGAEGRAVAIDLRAGLAIIETGLRPSARRITGRDSHAKGELAPPCWRLPDHWDEPRRMYVHTPDVYDDPEAHARDIAADKAAWRALCVRSAAYHWRHLTPAGRALALAELSALSPPLAADLVSGLADLPADDAGTGDVWSRLHGIDFDRVQDATLSANRAAPPAGGAK